MFKVLQNFKLILSNPNLVFKKKINIRPGIAPRNPTDLRRRHLKRLQQSPTNIAKSEPVVGTVSAPPRAGSAPNQSRRRSDQQNAACNQTIN